MGSDVAPEALAVEVPASRIKVKEVKGVRVVVVKAGEKEDSPDNADTAANESEA